MNPASAALFLCVSTAGFVIFVSSNSPKPLPQEPSGLKPPPPSLVSSSTPTKTPAPSAPTPGPARQAPKPTTIKYFQGKGGFLYAHSINESMALSQTGDQAALKEFIKEGLASGALLQLPQNTKVVCLNSANGWSKVRIWGTTKEVWVMENEVTDKPSKEVTPKKLSLDTLPANTPLFCKPTFGWEYRHQAAEYIAIAKTADTSGTKAFENKLFEVDPENWATG